MAGVVIFNMINVNAQERNALIMIGENSASNWDTHNKNQMSVGMIYNAFAAGTALPANLFILSDNDLVDTKITEIDGIEFSASKQV